MLFDFLHELRVIIFKFLPHRLKDEESITLLKCSVQQHTSFVKETLECSHYRAFTQLESVVMLFVDFVSNLISARHEENDPIYIIKFILHEKIFADVVRVESLEDI